MQGPGSSNGLVIPAESGTSAARSSSGAWYAGGVRSVERSNDPGVGRALKERIERFNMETTGIWRGTQSRTRCTMNPANLRAASMALSGAAPALWRRCGCARTVETRGSAQR